MRRWLFIFFSIPTTQRTHLFILLVIIVLFSFYIAKGGDAIYEPQQLPTSASTDSFIRMVEATHKELDSSTANFSQRLHFFNPNTLSYEGFLRLGIKEKLARTLIHYREKGGRFYRAEDLKKIYGMSLSTYERLRSYVRIDEDAPKKSHDHYKSKHPMLDINIANVEAIDSLPYMPTFIANRVIKYRNILGGFYSTEQLKEVYGLDSFKWEKIKDYIRVSPNYVCVKIPINEADFYTLKKHPYFRYEQVKEIVAYRKKEGPILDTHVLKGFSSFRNMSLSKIYPYLQF